MRTFNLDEFEGLSPEHPGSFRTYMDQHLFGAVGLRPAQIGFLRGDAADPAAECARYERAIAAAGGIDLLVCGLGTNGHIAFNEPGPLLWGPTHVAALLPETRAANAALFGGELARVPTHALTMGMRTILRARRILVLATGTAKAAAVAAMHHGPLTTMLPASWLQVHAGGGRAARPGRRGGAGAGCGPRLSGGQTGGAPPPPPASRSRSRGSMSSPMASRSRSWVRRRRLSAFW